MELSDIAVVDSFKNNLSSIPHISAGDRSNIERNLNILVDKDAERGGKREAATWLWKYFFRHSLTSISIMDNLRGFNELSLYFDDFAEYENLLFAIDKNYRDHIIHSIWVMLIGDYLQSNMDIFREIDFAEYVRDVGQTKETGDRTKEVLLDLTKSRKSLWFLIALSHDLGYPIEKTKQANQLMSKMTDHFGFLEQRDFEYHFSIVNQPVIDEMLDIIASHLGVVTKDDCTLYVAKGVRLDFAKGLERLEHGIMSSYLLVKYIDCICELKECQSTDFIHAHSKIAAFSLFTTIWLESVTSHSHQNRYWSSYGSLSFLLFLADELDELSRYSYSTKKQNWISLQCRTELECTEHSLHTIFTFDNKDLSGDILPFFANKVRKLHSRVSLSKDSLNEIGITCTDVRKAPPVTYTYIKNTSDKMRGKVIVQPDTEKDADTFLSETNK